jgi:hypothetical protein
MSEGHLSIWKFLISDVTWVQDPEEPGIQYRGIVAAVVAETEAQARELLSDYGRRNGIGVTWLRAAQVIELSIADGTFICWSQT